VHHFACATFARAAGIELRSIPYKSSAQALMDVASGQVPVGIGFGTELEPLVKDGRIRVLAAFAPARLSKFPAAPTLVELGYASLDFRSFNGFYAPAGTPAAIVNKLHQDSMKALAHPETRASLTKLGLDTVGNSSGEFAAIIKSDIAKWTKVIKEAGITASD